MVLIREDPGPGGLQEMDVSTMRTDSMLRWYPALSRLDIKQPETSIVEIPHGQLSGLVNGSSTLGPYMREFNSILDSLGPFPIFLRTDMSAQKYSFKSSCRLPDKISILPHILHIINANINTGLVDNAIVFRKWVDLEAGFAAFNNLPIIKGARVYMRDANVTCIHPKWTAADIHAWPGVHHDTPGSPGLRDGWEDILGSQNSGIEDASGLLHKLGEKVAPRLGLGKWVADFAYGYDGDWYLLDVEGWPSALHTDDCSLWK